MIVIGVDVHKHSLTAVAVDEGAGCSTSRRSLHRTAGCSPGPRSSRARLWALEDCRQLTRWLEPAAAGRRRAAGAGAVEADGAGASCGTGTRGVDPIDALAVARAALRGPRLSRPRPDEQPVRD